MQRDLDAAEADPAERVEEAEGDGEIELQVQGPAGKQVAPPVCRGQLRLEEFANIRDVGVGHTMVCTAALAVLWFVHLLTVAGLENHAWYFLAIGSLGMVQNYVVAVVMASTCIMKKKAKLADGMGCLDAVILT